MNSTVSTAELSSGTTTTTTTTNTLHGQQLITSSITPETQTSAEKDVEDASAERRGHQNLGGDGRKFGRTKVIDYRDQMLERFQKIHFASMPDCDRDDLLNQQFASSKQAVPEFAHEVYLFLREEEKTLVLTNYLRRQKVPSSQT